MAAGDEDPLDGVAIEDLRRQLGDEVVVRILTAYLEELPRYLGELRDGLRDGDSVLVARAAHSLKGASRLIGGLPVGTACDNVEKAAKQGQLDGLEADLAVVERLSAAIDIDVRARLRR